MRSGSARTALVATTLILAACGGGDDGGGSAGVEASSIPDTVATTSTTVFTPLTVESPGVESMCAAVRSTAGPGPGATPIEQVVRGQLARWSAVAGVAPESLAGHAETLAAFYERTVPIREEFGFDIVALARAGRSVDIRQTVEETVAETQMDAAVAVLCDQDPPGTFEPVDLDEDMLVFCAHFGNDRRVDRGSLSSAEYNEAFWTQRAELWQGAIELAPDELAADVATFAARYERIFEVYEEVGYDTADAVPGGIGAARAATDEEMAALRTVSAYLADNCDVSENGDLGAQLSAAG